MAVKMMLIDNCIIKRYNSGTVLVSKIKTYEKRHNVVLDLETILFIYMGSRSKDNELLSRFNLGIINFNDLVNLINK